MKNHLLLIVVSVAALSACNRGATNNSTAAAPVAPTAGGAAVPAPATTADPQLQAQLAQAAQAMSSQLPMKQQTPNGAVTFTAMEARGNELITTMSLPTDLDQATFGTQFGQALPAQACANPQMAGLVRRGAKITYIVNDSGGEEFTASVSSC